MSSHRPIRLLWFAGALALGASVLELLVVAWHLRLADVAIRQSAASIFLVPAVHLTIFAVAGGLVVLSLRGSRAPSSVGVFPLAALGALVALMALPLNLHILSVALFCLGAGALFYRLAAWNLPGLLRISGWIGAACMLAILAAAAVAAVTRSSANAPASGSAEGTPPNILLIILDTVRASSLSLYGHDRPTTPELVQWASDGLVFERAFAPGPWTVPSHASMFTGVPPNQLPVDWEVPYRDETRTLAALLRDRGYRTGGFVGNLFYLSRSYGLTDGFEHYEDHPVSVGQALLSTGIGRAYAFSALRRRFGPEDLLVRKDAESITRSFLDWTASSDGRPFFAFLNLFDAHEPYLPPEPYRSEWAPVGPRPLVYRGGLTRGEIAEHPSRWQYRDASIPVETNAYEASIAYLDATLAGMFGELERRGLWDNTIVVVTSDHGEALSEHGLWGHTSALYDVHLRVPLVIWGPGITAGRRTESVSLTDVGRTLLELSGNHDPDWPGRSWFAPRAGNVDRLGGSRPAYSHLIRGPVRQPWYPVAQGDDMHSIVLGPWHYICVADGTEELYDLDTDPQESLNRAKDAGEFSEPLRAARGALREFVADVPCPRPGAPPAPAPEWRPWARAVEGAP